MKFDLSREEEGFSHHVRQTLDDKIRREYVQWKASNTTPRRMFEILGGYA